MRSVLFVIIEAEKYKKIIPHVLKEVQLIETPFIFVKMRKNTLDEYLQI